MIGRSFSALSFVLSTLVVASSAQAQPIVFCPSGTQADLQAAVDAVDSPGVVVVPPGKWDVIGSVAVTRDGITILGAGASRTSLRRNPPPPNADASTRALYTAPFLRSKGTTSLRVSSLDITSWQATGGTEDLDVGISLTDVMDFRVDQCSFRLTGNSGVTVHGESQGVVDHCTFRDIYEPTIGNYGYGVSVYGTVHTGEPFGTARATFIENNSFDGCRHAVASNRGARYVFRHNVVRTNTVSHAIDTHGAEYPPSPKPACDPCYEADPDNPGTEWAVVHDNLVEAPDYAGYAITLRGGKGLVYRNTVRDYTTAIRLSKQTPQPTGPVYIWDNDVLAPTSLVVGAGTCCGSGPTWELIEPPGYTPYAHPHPLVVDVIADAGPDQRVMIPQGASVARVFVDGSGSKTAKSEVQSVRWFTTSTEASPCMRDFLDLPAGTHVVLLAAKDEADRVEYDTMVVEVLDHGSLGSSTSWADLWFAPFPGKGTISFELTPTGGTADAYVGLTGRHPAKAHEAHAMQVRINNQGFFDARNGDTYEAASAIPYEPGKSYHLEVAFDVTTQRYDVTVDGAELATGHAFRSAETSIGQLTAWNADGFDGLEVTGIVGEGDQTGPDFPCRDVGDAGVDVAEPPSDASEDAADAMIDVSVDAPADAGREAGGGQATGDGGGCGCRLVRDQESVGWTPWVVIGLLLALRRRISRISGVHGNPPVE
jgi:hypothetical protein